MKKLKVAEEVPAVKMGPERVVFMLRFRGTSVITFVKRAF